MIDKQPRHDLDMCVYSSARYSVVVVVVVVVGALRRDTNMEAVKKQKYLSLRFAIKTKSYYSKVSTH